MDKKYYEIQLIGCDDITNIKIELDEKEALKIKEISKLSIINSSYACQPTLEIEEITLEIEEILE